MSSPARSEAWSCVIFAAVRSRRTLAPSLRRMPGTSSLRIGPRGAPVRFGSVASFKNPEAFHNARAQDVGPLRRPPGRGHDGDESVHAVSYRLLQPDANVIAGPSTRT